MNPEPSTPVPNRWMRVGTPPRLVGVDVARSLAVIGMIGAHIGVTGVDESGVLDWGNPASWGAIVHGHSSVLFAVIAGVSLALLSGRSAIPVSADLSRVRLGLVGRGLAVFGIGLVLELLGTPVAVILTLWGMVFLLAPVFIGWQVRTLLIVAGALALAGPPLLETIRILSVGYGGSGAYLVLIGIYPLSVWLAFVFAGLALGRLGLDRTRVALVALGSGLVLAIVGPVLNWLARIGVFGPFVADVLGGTWQGGESFDDSWFSESIVESSSYVPLKDGFAVYLDQISRGWEQVLVSLLEVDPHSGGTLEILGSGGLAVALIALCVLVAPRIRPVIVPLAALGAMPLTAYSAHIVSLMILQGGPGGYLQPDNLVWAVTVAALLVGCTLWTLFLGRGPLERLVARAARGLSGVGARSGSKGNTVEKCPALAPHSEYPSSHPTATSATASPRPETPHSSPAFERGEAGHR